MCKAIKEWLEDERQEGHAEGLAEGRAAERLELMIQMYRDGDISIEKACMRLNLTEEEFFAEEKKYK